ncbi:MAG: hypothetical protein JWP29_5636 [Rhodoferax sp.]|nr:hypothetical protein [Rhodoferax sp.]
MQFIAYHKAVATYICEYKAWESQKRGLERRLGLWQEDYHKSRDERIQEHAESMYLEKYGCSFESHYYSTTKPSQSEVGLEKGSGSTDGESPYPTPDITRMALEKRVDEILVELNGIIAGETSFLLRSAKEAGILRQNAGSSLAGMLHMDAMGFGYYGAEGKHTILPTF